MSGNDVVSENRDGRDGRLILGRAAALARLSRPRLLVLDLFLFLVPSALVAAREGGVALGRLALPLGIFLIARVGSTLLDAYEDAAADEAAGAPQFASLARLGPRTAAALAYAGGAACVVLAWWVNRTFFAVVVACVAGTALQYVVRRLVPRSLLPFFMGTALAAAQSTLGWAALAELDAAAALLFLAVLAWDVSHDCLGAIRDLEGDRAAGVETPALRFGVPAAWRLAGIGLATGHVLLCGVAVLAGAWLFVPAGLLALGVCLWDVRRGRRRGDGAAAGVRRHVEAYLMIVLVLLAGATGMAALGRT